MSRRSTARCAGFATVVAMLAGPAPALEGQDLAGAVSTLTGSVLEADAGRPIADAELTLRRIDRSTDSTMTAFSDVMGRYRFPGLAPGIYELRVERLGFHPARVEVDLGSVPESRLSFGLRLDPIELEPVSVEAEMEQPFNRNAPLAAEEGDDRAAARSRQRRYLASDVWSLTHGAVVEAVTLGERDLFRALQRLPGVSTRDEWTAELWTRGADWDQTRVYFDGLPLFSPLHGAGLLSGVDADAVGLVDLHPGVRPVGLGEGVAAVDLVSRKGGSGGGLHGFGALSLASSRLSLDGPLAEGDGGWMLAARRTYVDVLAKSVDALFSVDDARVPYGFSDVTARIDHPVGSGQVSASMIWARDHISGDIPDVIHGSEMTWGNLGIRASWERPLGSRVLRHTLGFIGYDVSVDTVPVDPRSSSYSAPSAGEIQHRVRHALLRGELRPRESQGWNAGYEVMLRTGSASGETPPAYLEYVASAEPTIDLRQDLSTLGGWLEGRWRVGAVEVMAGTRVEGSPAVANSGRLRLAPRVTARVHLDEEVTVSAAVGRSWQYHQTLGPIAYFRPDFPAGHLWLMAGSDVPALRADVATLGGEAWMGERWLLSTTAWLRRSADVLIPDPRPGNTLGRPLFTSVDEEGQGVELALRRLHGRLTGSLSYSLARTEQQVDDLRFAAGVDRRHQLDATAMYRLTPALRLGAAFTHATGWPYTRVVEIDASEEVGTPIGIRGPPNAERLPTQTNVDLMFDWTKQFTGWSLSGFLQLRNAFARNDKANYTGTNPFCPSGHYVYSQTGDVLCGVEETPAQLRDEFLSGMPMIPLFGFRVEF